MSAAEISSGAGGGFDEAALAAAKRFIFEPARRGERPVPSRIVYRYHFELKPPPSPAQVIEPARLAGRVLIAETGEPLVAARARLFRGETLLGERTSDEQGKFELAGSPRAVTASRSKRTASNP